MINDQQEYKRQMREKEIFEKQRERDKWYIRQPKKLEVKKYHYYSESKIESKPEAYHNYDYDESDGKTLPPKKIKRGRRNLSEEENNAETEEEEEEAESKNKNDNRKIKKQTKQKRPPPNKETKKCKNKKKNYWLYN